MSDPYLLAASLLTAGPITVPPPPALPPNSPDSLSALLASTIAQTLQSAITPNIAPIVELVSTEFSQSQSNPAPIDPVLALAVDGEATQQAINLQALPKPQSTVLLPVSGSQLYVQRLMALKAGKIYTRLPADSFQSFWAKGTGTQAQALQQPTHEQWIHLLEQEAEAMARGQGANRLGILVGDSLSMWFPTERLPGGQLWLNQGISGENSGQVANRLSAFSQTRPDTIYVLAGINDLRQGASDEVILNNLRQIVRRLRLNHPRSQVVLQSILPTRLSAISNQRIWNLNQQIAAIARQEGTGYLNLYTLFADSQGQLRQDLTTDGIHLTRRGYEVWQEALNYAESVIASNRISRVSN